MDVGLCVRDARDECNCFPWERVDFSVSVRLESVEEDRTEHVAPSVDGSDLGWQDLAAYFEDPRSRVEKTLSDRAKKHSFTNRKIDIYT